MSLARRVGLLAAGLVAGAFAGHAFLASARPAPPQEERMTQSKPARPASEELRRRLTPEQFRVTQECGTEPPFHNAYWNHHADGIYVDVVSGEALFSSKDKFDSGSGWPSFTRPLVDGSVVEKSDRSHGMVRTEVRSKEGDSHLGHVFDDGPGPNGLRYCINSASLRFVPAEKLVEEGYGSYAALFPDVKQTAAAPARETAVLAGGCFWGMEDLIRKVPGVIDTEVGYAGGAVESPVYEQVKTGRTGHAEAIRVIFDPKVLSYAQLLEFYFRIHDPTTPDRQGNDVGTQYRSAIFPQDERQAKVAAEVRAKVDASGKWKKPLVTKIEPAGTFWAAEGYHQDYLEKHPGGYTCHFLRD